MRQYLLTISMDGNEAVPCLPIGENALGLNCEGITWQDNAVVWIRCNAQNELCICAESDTPVILERSGRRLSLKAREIRLLPQDVIYFDGHRFEIASMRRYGEQKRRFSSRQAMLSAAAAASLAIATLPACQPKAGAPETPPQVESRLAGDIVEAPNINIIPGPNLTSTEGESAAELYVTPTTIPSDSLHIEISADAFDQVVFSPDSIDGIIKTGDIGAKPKKVEIRCIDDGIEEGVTEVKMKFKVTSNDPDYNNLEAEQSIFCVDNQSEPIEPEPVEPRLMGDVAPVKPAKAPDQTNNAPANDAPADDAIDFVPVKKEKVEPRLMGDVVRIPPDEKPETDG